MYHGWLIFGNWIQCYSHATVLHSQKNIVFRTDLDVYLIGLFEHVASEQVQSKLVSKTSENKIRNVPC